MLASTIYSSDKTDLSYVGLSSPSTLGVISSTVHNGSGMRSPSLLVFCTGGGAMTIAVTGGGSRPACGGSVTIIRVVEGAEDGRGDTDAAGMSVCQPLLLREGYGKVNDDARLRTIG